MDGVVTEPALGRAGKHLAHASRTRGVLPPFADLAPEYDRWFDGDGRSVFQTELSALAEVSADLPKPWLEIGVGSGRFAHALGIEAGVDPSLKMVELARKRGVNAFVGRGEQRLFDEESFGTVFLIATLCFLKSPRGVFKEARHVLAPDGRLVLGLLLRDGRWGQLYQQKKEKGHRFYRYATFYSFDEVTALLEQEGFVTERVVSTLLAKPGQAKHLEEPREGYHPDAGFTVVLASRLPARRKRRRRAA